MARQMETKEMFEKVLDILQKQQNAIDTLNDATSTTARCGCCSTGPVARKEVEAAAQALEMFREDLGL